MLYKFLSQFLIVTILLGILPVYNTSAAFSLSTFTVNSNTNPSIYLNPGDTFSLDITGENDSGGDINNTAIEVSFSNNSFFTYSGNDQRTAVQYINVNDLIPAADYSLTNGLVTQISSNTVADGQVMMFRRKSNNYNGFSIINGIETFSNTISTKFTGYTVNDNDLISGSTQTKNIFVNVKPHIVDKYFSKNGNIISSIQGNNAEQVDLFIAVKDYNGCSNIDNGIITANLSALGLQSNEILNYHSCGLDNKTALFKKSAISTNNTLGNITLSANSFSATDENNNTIDPSDSHFGEAVENNDLLITVVSPGAPTIDTITLSDNYIGGSGQLTSILEYQSSQTGESKVTLDSCGTSDPLKILQSSQVYSGSTLGNFIINSSVLSEGVNNVFVCIDNGLGDEGSSSIELIKDIHPPIISGFSNTSNITTQDLSVDFTCNEEGEYQVSSSQGGNTQIINNYSSLLAGMNNANNYSNSLFPLGENTLIVSCRDNAGNTVDAQTTFTKYSPTPSMLGQITNFSDNDIDYSGLNGLDINLSWNTTIGENFSGFDSWKVIILPSNVALDIENHTTLYTSIIAGSGAYKNNIELVNDSTNTAFINGGEYKAYVYMLGKSLEKGIPAESAIAVFTADSIEQASVINAEFIGDEKLKLYTDTILDPNVTGHNPIFVKYSIAGQQKTAYSVDSVSGQDITYIIENLNNTALTGDSLQIGTGALHSNVGGFNDFLSPSIIINDKQKPLITGFVNNSTPTIGNFYPNFLNITWENSEDIAATTSTLNFVRTAGNLDPSIHKISITSAAELTSGSHSKDIYLNSNTDSNKVQLNCGTSYKLQLQITDINGNTSNISELQNISYDECKPDITTLVEKTIEGANDVNLSWNIPLDDAGNGSGIKDYNIFVYPEASCSGSPSEYNNTLGNTQSVNLINGNYSWKVQANDNMGNIGDFSDCDSFEVNSNIPTFNTPLLTDTGRSDTQYLKAGNTLKLTTSVLNSDILNISADLSKVTGDADDNNVSCASPSAGITCSFTGNNLEYNFVSGLNGTLSQGTAQITITANNTSGINTKDVTSSITIDTQDPQIIAGALTFPNGGEIFGGLTTNITWSTGQITDFIGLDNLEVSYSKAGVLQGIICSSSNTGTCSWDISSLTSASDYNVTITAFDLVGNTTLISSLSNFSIDRTLPSVPNNTLTYTHNGMIAGGKNIDITWDSSLITDNIALDAQAISLSFSNNNGVSFQEIATSLANNGIYTWTTPIFNSPQNIIQLTAKDSVGNINSDTINLPFILDSIEPILDISYAGNGGNTPANGKYINNSGLNLTLSSSDTHLDSVYYSFQNITDNTYWSGSSYSGTLIENILCSDTNLLGTAGNCNTITQTINPLIQESKNYRIIFYSRDEAGNITTSNPSDYTGDITAPEISIITSDNLYVSDIISIEGTSSDSASEISSVLLQIKKGTTYWNGSSFVDSIESLITSSSDNYNNWNYTFKIPAGDNEDQNYEITAIANDNAFKDNNTHSSTINIKKDSVGPIISNNIIITPTGGNTYSGGDDIYITWTHGGLSDIHSGLKTNPITLEYFDGSTYQNIASDIANNGSFSWEDIPAIDTSNVNIRITASDQASNTSFQNSNSFIIDSTDPTISRVETLENSIADGSINALKVIFSESINDTTVSIADFSIDGGAITPRGFSSGINTNDNEIIILFDATGTTASKPTLRYSGITLADVIGRKLAPTSTINSIDKANPRVQSIEAFDSDNNGKLDRIIVDYSENLNNSSSITGLLINNAISGMAINGASISADILTLTLTESNNPHTSTDSIDLSSINPVYSDTAGNTVESFSNKTITDKALPVKVSSKTRDTNGNNKADTIVLEFSENISGATLGNFSLTQLSTGTALIGIATTGNTVNLTLQETTDIDDSFNNFLVSYSGTAMIDGANNQLAPIPSHSSIDTLPAYIKNRSTFDNNGNGKIDAIEIEFSENMNDDFSALSYTVDGYTTTGFDTLLSNDTIIRILLAEKEVTDSEITPDIQIVSNTSLGDSSNNLIANEGSAITSQDKVGPIIIGSRYDEKSTGVDDDMIYVTFSEAINSASIDSSIGGAANDFILSNPAAFAANSITQIVSPTEVTITLGSGATPLNPGTTIIGIQTAGLEDIGNTSSPISGVDNKMIVSTSVIVNEIMYNGTLQYIELKNLGSNPVDLNGWYLQNVESGNQSLLLTTGSIPAKGHYLISNLSEADSILTITPDLINTDLQLNTSSQLDIILRNSSTIFDTIQSSPWAAGDANIPKSMERKQNPGNGLDLNNWYTAEGSLGFDSSIPKGTPGSENIFDAVAPTLSGQFPLDNTLLPIAAHIKFEYSDDNVGIDTNTIRFELQKWNGSSYGLDISLSSVESHTNDELLSYYLLKDIPAGKYKAIFQVADNAGNLLQKDTIFYIDSFTAKIINTSISLDDITAGGNNFSNQETEIQITSLGRDFDITQSKSGLFAQGSIAIQDYDGQYGFGSDLYKNEDTSITSYTNNLHKINNSTLVESSFPVDTNGVLKTYTYKLKYGAKIGGMQEPGEYNTKMLYNIVLN